jgi:ArsR family transcriptional regulator, zinc-responsive transcriptional repressor
VTQRATRRRTAVLTAPVDDPHAGQICTDVEPAVRTSRTLSAAGDLLRALAAPVRIAIVLELRDGPQCVHDLVDALLLPQPLISQHLRVLKEAGVVHGERRGREVVYSLVDDHLAHIVLDAVAHAGEDT